MLGKKKMAGLILSLLFLYSVAGLARLEGFNRQVLGRGAYSFPPAGFEDTLVASIPGTPTDVAWTPDGRILIPMK